MFKFRIEDLKSGLVRVPDFNEIYSKLFDEYANSLGFKKNPHLSLTFVKFSYLEYLEDKPEFALESEMFEDIFIIKDKIFLQGLTFYFYEPPKFGENEKIPY